MTTRDDHRKPDHIRRRAARVRFGEALLAAGALLALAVGLMVPMPAIASAARKAPPATQATFQVCTIAVLPDDGETGVEPTKPRASRLPCGASARTTRLVVEASRPDRAGSHEVRQTTGP